VQDNIQKVNQIKDNFLAELKDVKLDISSVNELKAKFVGKAGLLNQLFKEISFLQIDQKKISVFIKSNSIYRRNQSQRNPYDVA
jgi:hypothetical protein